MSNKFGLVGFVARQKKIETVSKKKKKKELNWVNLRGERKENDIAHMCKREREKVCVCVCVF